MRIVSIGECMVEMAPDATGKFVMGYAGDTFNTAWYLRDRLAVDWRVDFVTAIGDDRMSEGMLGFFRSEGIGTAHVGRIAQCGVGLYVITLAGTERSFTYWRETSAARRLADHGDRLAMALLDARLVYLSGITLAILPEAGRERLTHALAVAKAAGATLAFDPNMRPSLWPDLDVMRTTIMRFAAMMDIVLPSFDEDAVQFGDAGPAETARRYAQAGAAMVVVKNGPGEIVLRQAADEIRFQPPAAHQVVDSTAAGDSFNAGFLAAWLMGSSATTALAEGAALARRVIAARGALVRG